jgi:hypothetical protein
MCWSSALAQSIVIAENSKTFSIKDDNLLTNTIETMQHQFWM